MSPTAPNTNEQTSSESSSLPVVNTFEDLREYLHAIHTVSVDSNDPVMLVFTMHRLFLADYERMLDRHNEAITAVMSDAIKGLTEEALSENLSSQVLLADRIQQEFERQYKRAKILSALNLCAAFICIPVLIFLFLK